MTEHHRKLFLHMPKEIFDPWIDAKFQLAGWTYPASDSDLIGWSRRHCGFTLRELADFRWTHGIYALKQLHYLSIIEAQQLMQFSLTGQPARLAEIHNTQKRFSAATDFIRENRRIPVSLAGIGKDGAIEILDGFHRLAALFHVTNQKVQVPDEIPIWVASCAA